MIGLSEAKSLKEEEEKTKPSESNKYLEEVTRLIFPQQVLLPQREWEELIVYDKEKEDQKYLATPPKYGTRLLNPPTHLSRENVNDVGTACFDFLYWYKFQIISEIKLDPNSRPQFLTSNRIVLQYRVRKEKKKNSCRRTICF